MIPAAEEKLTKEVKFMKLNFGKKLVLFLHWLLSLIVCAVFALVCFAPQLLRSAANFCGISLNSTLASWLLTGMLVVYALVSLCALITLFSNGKKRGERGMITVDSSDSGKTRIAMGAIEQMIRQAVRGVDGIADMKCAIINDDDAIRISVNVNLLEGGHVPTVTMNMQRAIRGYIELNCGVAVREICVNVHSVDSGEGKKYSKRNLTAQAAPMDHIDSLLAQNEAVPAPESEATPRFEATEAAEEALSEGEEAAQNTEIEETIDEKVEKDEKIEE